MRQLLVRTALAAALLAACDLEPRVTSDAARDTWAMAQPRARDQVTNLRDRQKVLAGRVAALQVPAGTNDAALQALITELQTAVAQLEAPIAAVEADLAQATTDVDAALTKQNKVEARRTVEVAVARLEPRIAAAGGPLDALEPRIAEAEAGMQRGLAAVASEGEAMRRIARDGGNLQLTDIEFAPDSPTLDTGGASQAALIRLLGLASTCDELRLSIAGHTARGADAGRLQALSLARAEAVKAYLIAQGIAADKIAKTEGLGATKLVADEPEPGSVAAQAMAPTDLAVRRNKNERIEVTVTTRCGTAAAPTAAAPGQPVPADPARPAAGQPPTPPTAPVEVMPPTRAPR